MTMKYLIIIFSLTIWSCNTDPVVPVTETEPEEEIGADTLSLVWSKTLQEIGEPTHIMFTPRVLDKALYISEGKAFVDNWQLQKVDLNSGEYIDSLSISTASRLDIVNNSVQILESYKNTVCNNNLDVLEQTENSNMSYPEGSNYQSLLFRRIEGSNDSYSAIISKDLTEPNGDWKEVVRQEREGSNWRPFLGKPATEINNEGDTLLYMRSYHWDNEDSLGGFRDRIDFHAYNMSKGEYIWSHKDFTPYRGANAGIPKIVGDYIYFVGKVSVFCLNKHTGETIWEKVYVSSEGFLGGNDYIVANDLLYVRGGQGTLRAFDLMTGDIIWQEDGIGSSFNMYVDDNYVIYSTATLHVLDAHTGKQLYIHDRHRVNSELTYDPETRRIFAAGIGTLYCFEIPAS